MKATIDEIRKVIGASEVTTKDPASFDPDLPLAKQGIDSLDMATLILNVEDAFDLSISHKDYEKLQSINDILAYIETAR